MQADTTPAPADTVALTAPAEVPFMPPHNGGYMVAAYIVAGTIYLVYAASLILRARAARR
ncbi:MAG: hypothetical protein SF070_04025 [Gemmatimonadota bacterium]|nr:hypothetical protein [Gemmatimonadota bacterium]